MAWEEVPSQGMNERLCVLLLTGHWYPTWDPPGRRDCRAVATAIHPSRWRKRTKERYPNYHRWHYHRWHYHCWNYPRSCHRYCPGMGTDHPDPISHPRPTQRPKMRVLSRVRDGRRTGGQNPSFSVESLCLSFSWTTPCPVPRKVIRIHRQVLRLWCLVGCNFAWCCCML